MARRKRVKKWQGESFTLELGSAVLSEWGGQVPGQRPRTKRGTIYKLMDDGGFWAQCEKTGKRFSGTANTVINVLKPGA